MTASIETRDLAVRYGQRTVIERLNLAIPAGQVVALLGGNGAGKTTTIQTLLGFVSPAAGQVLVGARDLAGAPEAARRLAYLPENVALYPYLSGIENLRYFCALADIDVMPAEAHTMLAAAGLAEAAHAQRVAGYSKGMRQKVGLAIAYARSAVGMLLDEPTSGLDPAAANDFAARVRQAADAGMAVLMATHDLFNARQVADRIAIMRAGALVAEVDAHTIGHQELEDLYLHHARGLA